MLGVLGGCSCDQPKLLQAFAEAALPAAGRKYTCSGTPTLLLHYRLNSIFPSVQRTNLLLFLHDAIAHCAWSGLCSKAIQGSGKSLLSWTGTYSPANPGGLQDAASASTGTLSGPPGHTRASGRKTEKPRARQGKLNEEWCMRAAMRSAALAVAPP